MMMKRDCGWVVWACVSLLGLSLSPRGFGGDLTTDGLTVKAEAQLRGPVELVHQSAPEAYPTNGLVLYYSFSTNGTTKVTDLSGNSNTGTVVGATWVSSGKVDGGAMSFDGSGDYVEALDSASLDVGTSDFSISFWFKGSGGTDKGILTKGGYSGPGYEVQINNAGVVGISHDTSSSTYAANVGDAGASLDGNWHHFTATHDRDGLATLYIDGAQARTLSISAMGTLDNNEKLYLGRRPNGKNFIGSLDEVLIYSRLLSTNEISVIYAYDSTVNTNGGHLVAESAAFSKWVTVPPAGDIPMGTYTNAP